MLECRLDTAAFAECTSPSVFSDLAQGSHTFQVRAKDSVGNTSGTTSRTWTADTVAPPAPSIASGPAEGSFVSSTSASIGFTNTEAGVTFECRYDAAAFAACTTPAATSGLSEGAHSFQVLAKDSVGNTSTTTTRNWTVDTVAPPVPAIDSGPTGTVASTSATFTFSDTEAGVTFECKLDTGAFAACTSPANLSGLAQGSHSYEMRAKDAAGNTASATRAWSVDTAAPPVPTFSAGPTGSVSSTDASFAFSDTEPGVTFECRRDADPFAVCTSPVDFTGLAEGAHTFDVRAKDALANTSAAATRSWTVDTTVPPIPTITSGPSATVGATTASFGFTGEAGATFECRRDAGAFATCTSPSVYTGLTNGAHSFEVRAKDAAGNLSSGATRAWAVDSVAPNTTITAGPKTGKATTATFKFTATEVGSTFKCKLDKAAWATCKTGKAYKKLKKGAHTFQVAATDKYGNLDKTPAKKTWKIT